MILPESFKTFSLKSQAHMSKTSQNVPVICCPKESHPSSTIIFFTRAGVAYEKAQEWGASHFLEHILMRGTDKYSTLYDISGCIEGLGGQVSAYSTRDLAAYWVKLPAYHEEIALDVLTQILFHPKIEPEFIASECAIIRQELFREQASPGLLTADTMESLLLRPLPLSRHPIGLAKDLPRFQPEFLRSFLSKYYQLGNMSVVASGQISPEFPELLNKALENAPLGSPAQLADFACGTKIPQGSVILRQEATKGQVFAAMGWQIPIANLKELVTWRVINTLLGSGYTSLLNQSLREKHSLTYVCSTALNAYGQTGIFKLQMALTHANLPKALDMIEEIIGNLAQGKVSLDIFNQAIVRHASGLVFRYENSFETARLIGHSFIHENRVFNLKEYLEELEKVSLKDASQLAEKYLNPKMRLMYLYTDSQEVKKAYPNAQEAGVVFGL